MIPAPHPQWRDLDLVEVAATGAAFVNLGSQNSLLNPGGAVKAEGIWNHGRQPGGCHLNMLALAAVAREADLPFFWFRWERLRHRHPASPMDAVQYAYWRRDLAGDLDAQRDWNADLVDDVKAILRPEDVTIVYPAFASIFVGTPFEMHLTRRGIRTLLLSGYHTEWCIESAARSARDLGYMPLVVGDACAAETPEVHLATLQRLNAIFAPVVSTQTAIELVRKAATAGRLRSRPGTTA